MNKPIAVIAGDIHYNLKNLELADKSTRMAITKANELKVPFIANGDTWDQKANLRAECVNAMIETFQTAKIQPIVNIGNHCKLNEKSEAHALNFLRSHAIVVDNYLYDSDTDLHIIAYQSSLERLRRILSYIPSGEKLVMHQGITGASPGDYIKDASAVRPEDVSGYHIIASHYHTRQTIPLPCGGTWDYIGNPYSLNWAEANDPPKGFQILYSNGSLEFIPTNLRKHVIWEFGVNPKQPAQYVKGDLLWVKYTDTREKLALLSKENIAERFGIDEFRFTKQPIDTQATPVHNTNLTQSELLDSIIDCLPDTSTEGKARIKTLWKDM